ncbi:MAG: ABC transporter ATP-binding protein [Bacillota bacterium]
MLTVSGVQAGSRGQPGESEPKNDSPAVLLKDVTKVFRSRDREVRVLDGVSFEVQRGASVGILGHSGAGKSTLLSIIAGIEQPTSGLVQTGGVDLLRARPSDLPRFRFQHVGFVFQQYHLIPTLNALENVMLPSAPWKVDYDPRQRATELLGMVGLADRADHLPSQLSGGEQQRVSIARALINRPTLLLADEPTGNLDEDSEQEVMGLIRDLADQFGMTLLFVTHSRELAASFQRVVRLKNGVLVDSD